MISGAKYSMIYPPLVARVCEEEKRKGAKDWEKATKTRLHQMFGAYVQGNAQKKVAALLDNTHPSEYDNARREVQHSELDNARHGVQHSGHDNARHSGLDPESILSLHASTKERLPYYPQFYTFITTHVPNIQTIMDLGCGFNPFSLHHLPNLKTYHAYDIDTRTRDLLNRFFAQQSLPQTAACTDLAVETPAEKADLALLCKLVPVLEAQCTGRGFELARQLDTQFLAITYPTKSLGGREKGMGKNYAAQFEKAYENGELGDFTLLVHEQIGNELMYILQKV